MYAFVVCEKVSGELGDLVGCCGGMFVCVYSLRFGYFLFCGMEYLCVCVCGSSRVYFFVCGRAPACIYTCVGVDACL